MMMWSVSFSPRVTEKTTRFPQHSNNWAIQKITVFLNPHTVGLFSFFSVARPPCSGLIQIQRT